MSKQYRDFEIEPFELGKGLWHARFSRVDRQPILIDGVIFPVINAGVAWHHPEAAVADAKAAIDRLAKIMVVSGSQA